MEKKMQCPVCKSLLRNEPTIPAPDTERYDCTRCGEFDLAGSAIGELPGKIDRKPHRRALFSHKLRRMQSKTPPRITSYELDSMWQEERLPSPLQQERDLVLLIGDHQQSPGAAISMARPFLHAWIGASLSRNQDDLRWLELYLIDSGLLKDLKNANAEKPDLQLTFRGWQRYSELKREQIDSRFGFMAMKFGDDEMDRVVATCFKPAVANAGFELRVMTEPQPAGLIDDRLRANLLAARFVVADLSHKNNGAYWEAGFAEGLNRPVFYTCKESIWQEEKTHFDTNHMTTIIWNPDKLAEAGAKLTASIRVTFRAGAKQE